MPISAVELVVQELFLVHLQMRQFTAMILFGKKIADFLQ